MDFDGLISDQVETIETSAQKVVTENYQDAPKDSICKSSKDKSSLVVDKQKKWFEETRQFAEHSAKLIGDKSIGVHIKAWSLARKNRLREELVEIVLICEKQRQKTGAPQGKAFSFLTRQLFLKHGVIQPDPEAASIRAALASAPFMAEGGFAQ